MKISEAPPILHPSAHPDGGQACPDEDLLKRQREAIGEWLKAMGQRLFSGNLNILNTPFPVKMFEPRSYLEKLAEPWGVELHLLYAAASTPDPARRMALVIAHFVAGIHIAFERWQKPFNPILGETWQARLPDGTRLDMEQVSHHPPVSAFYMEGPGFKFVGKSQPSVQLSLRDQGFKSTCCKGYRYILFADGSKIDIHNPGFVFKNVVGAGKPRAEVFGTAFFADMQNNLCGMLSFGPSDKGAGAAAVDSIKRRSDAFMGGIYDVAGTAMADPAWIMQQRVGEGEDSHRRCSSDSNSSSGSEDDAGQPHQPPSKDSSPGTTPQETLSVPGKQGAALAEKRADELKGGNGGLVELGGNGLQQGRARHASKGGLFAGFNRLVGGLKPGPTASSAVRGVGTALGRLHTASWGSKAKSQAQADQQPGVQECGSMGRLVTRVEGSWLSHLDVGAERMWTWATQRHERFIPVEAPLPSDSRFREDLAALRTGDVAEAGRWKHHLEQRQRADSALREAGRCGG